MSGFLTPAYMIRGEKPRLVCTCSLGKKPRMTEVGLFNPMLYELGLKSLRFCHSGFFIPTTQSLGVLPHVILAGVKNPDF